MGKRRALISYILHILLHVFIYIGFIAVVPLGNMFNYVSFVKQVLGIEDVVVCPPNCAIELAPQRHDLRAVIVVDNPSGTPVALSVNTTQGQGRVIITDRTTRLEVFFNGGLYVDVYPLYPLSDAEPRSVYLPSGGNLTIRVTPPAIGGIIPTFIAVIGTVIGIMTSLGIIRHVTRTPLVDTIGDTFPMSFEPLFIFWLILSLTLVEILIISLISYDLMIKIWLLLILIIIYTAIILVQVPEFVVKIVFSYLVALSILSLLSLLRTPTMSNPLLYFILFIILTNPITLIYFKSLVAVEEMDRTRKVGVLYLYDLTVAFWALQWLINPYPAIFKQFIYNLSLQLIILIIIIPIYFGLFIMFLLIRGPSLRIFSLSAIPFVFDEELAARIEFCRRVLDWPTKVRVYPEGGGSVEGFVVGCDVDKITIDDTKSTRVFSWGDVQQLELL